jgi:hypothetical protein
MAWRAMLLGLAFFAPAAWGDEAKIALSVDSRSFLEGEWRGVTVDTNANKLCAKDGPQSTVLVFEFMRSGGVALFDNGVQEESGRRKIVSASDGDGILSVELDGQMAAFSFRKDGPDRMALVRNSASLGMPVDVMVFKRCRAAADRANIALSADTLRQFAAEMPGDTPYFVDTRIAAKISNACNAAQVQYLFFGLLGPVEFRVSRWNSFDLADALEAKKKPAFALDAVGDWAVQSAMEAGGNIVLTVRDLEKADAAPFTLTLESRGDGRVAIPEWKREYVRCKGFDQRS